MRETLVIIGAGGHGKSVANVASLLNKWKHIYFLDDLETKAEVMGIKVLDKACHAVRYIEDSDVFVAIGDNTVRKRMLEALNRQGARIPSIVHPTAVVGKDVHIGSGVVVMAGAVINCGTTIKDGCIINTGAIVEHDNLIEPYVHLSPGVTLAGAVTVGEKTWIGANGTVIDHVFISGHCKIGAGAVVIKDIVDSGTYVGVPARRVSLIS